MYEEFFGLHHRPFPAVPRVESYFPATAIEAARGNLIRCISRGDGPGMVVGPTGTGKTLLCQVLAARFQSQFRVALLRRGFLSTRRNLLQAILYELGQPYRGMDEGELRLALSDYVAQDDRGPEGVLLIVDEAHALPIRLLDEIRMLTNLAAKGQPRVRLVLAGSNKLEERMAAPRLDSFNQRIAARCYLEALNATETEQYVLAQLRAAGGQAEQIFPQPACQSVHRATDGVPRLVNQLCDHVLLLACADGRRQIEPSCVEEAWADLQQLPTPWNADRPAPSSGESLIEFGGLEDEPAKDASPADVAPQESRCDALADEPATPAACADEPAISAAFDDKPSTPEPLEQLRQIQDAISELEEDYQPVGPIVPEVELVFADPGNPFSEAFAEEEVVVERYASGAGSSAPTAAPAAAEPNVPLRQPESPPAQNASAETPPEDLRSQPVPSAPATPPAAAEPPEVRQTVPMHRELSAQVETDDSDMIVVEEGYEDVPVPTIRPATPVGRHEYRRLFAKLRHG